MYNIHVDVYTLTRTRAPGPLLMLHAALRQAPGNSFSEAVLGCPRAVGSRGGLHISIWYNRLASSPCPAVRRRLTYIRSLLYTGAKTIPDTHEVASCQRLINGRRRRCLATVEKEEPVTRYFPILSDSRIFRGYCDTDNVESRVFPQA